MSQLSRSVVLGSRTFRLFSSTSTGLKNLVVCNSYSACLISQTVKSLEQYEALKTNPSDLLVGWFTAKWSTAGKLFDSDFEKLAEQFPQHTFFKCDVDEVPKAAYDAEVVDSPQVSIIPTGSKPDGSLYCKSDMVTIKARLANYSSIVLDAKKSIEQFRFGEAPAEKKPWVFDPATGTTIPQHESY